MLVIIEAEIYIYVDRGRTVEWNGATEDNPTRAS